LAKVARMDAPSVIRLLEIANNDLPAVELRYERSKKEAATLEYEKENSAREFQQVNNQIIMMSKTRDSTRLDCEKEMERLRHLQQQRIKQEDLVKHFENDNIAYIKIRKTVEEKVVSILSDAKPLLRNAILSLTESMRKDPSKYSSLIYHNNMSSTANYSGQYHSADSYGQQQQYPSHDYISMLLEESKKLYNKLAKESVGEIIGDCLFSTPSTLLPLLPQPIERSHTTTTTTADDQIHMDTEELRLTQSEVDDD
jgi:hypothetical protein